MSKDARKLVEAHWEGYVKPMLHAHGQSDELINIVGFHYVSAGIHFYGHAVENERNAQKEAARGAFLNGAVHGGPRFVIERDGKGCVERAGVVYETPADLAPVFALIAKEHSRSLEEHAPWDEAGHSPDTMLAVIKAELAEVELALSMGDYAETVKELVHVGNVVVKTISELTRRGML